MKEKHTKTAPRKTAANADPPLPTDKMERLRAAAAMPED
jgi:hypothetical protein